MASGLFAPMRLASTRSEARGKTEATYTVKVLGILYIYIYISRNSSLQAARTTAELGSKRVTDGASYVCLQLLIVKIMVHHGHSTTLSNGFWIPYHSRISDSRKQATHSQPKTPTKQVGRNSPKYLNRSEQRKKQRARLHPVLGKEYLIRKQQPAEMMRHRCRLRYGSKLSAFPANIQQ